MNFGSIDLGSPVNWASPLNQGLVSWWLPLPTNRGGGMLLDLCGRNHGTLSSMDPTTDWVPAMKAELYALDFDGSNDRVGMVANTYLQPALPVTMAAWVLAPSVGTARMIFANGKVSTAHSGVWLDIGATNTVSISFGDNDGGTGPAARRSFTTTATLTEGQWYHLLAVVRGATDFSVYFNGADQAGTTSGTGGALAYNGNCYIGGANTTSPWTGKLTDVRFWNRGLSATEALLVYHDSLLGYQGTLRYRSNRVVVEAEIPESGLSDNIVAFNMCWTWFNDPRAVYASATDTLFVGAIRNDGVVTFYSWNFTKQLLLQGTPRTAVLEADDHNNPAICLLESGKLLTAYSQHNGDSYSARTTNAHDIRTWDTPVQLASGAQDDTYAHLFQLGDDNDTVFWFFRNGDAATRPVAYRTSTDDGDTWSGSTDLVTLTNLRPYFKACKNGNLRIDFCLTESDPDEAVNSLYHGYLQISQNGSTITYHKTDGTEVTGAPFTPDEFTLVYDGTTQECWNWEIRAIGGSPVIVFVVYESNDIHHYHQARWNGSAWENDEVATGGTTATTDLLAAGTNYSGGVCLDPNDVNTVYCSREYSSTDFRLEKYTHSGTFPSGTWTKAEDTSGNTSTKNARPFCVDVGGTTHVLWWEGTYTDWVGSAFSTKLRMLPAPDWRGAKESSPVWTAGYAPAGVQGYFLLHEGSGTTANDLANNSDGSFTGSPAWNAGDGGDFGPFLNGFTTSDYVNVDTLAALIDETDYPIWIYVLYKTTSTGTTAQCPVGFGNAADTDPIFSVRVNATSATNVGGQWRDAASTSALIETAQATHNDGEFHVLQVVKLASNDWRTRFDGGGSGISTTNTGAVTFDRGAIGALRRGTLANAFLGEIHAVVVGWGDEPDLYWMAMDLIRGQFAGTFDPDAVVGHPASRRFGRKPFGVQGVRIY